MRALGRNPSSRGALRTVRRQVDAFGIDYSHFTGQRRWSDAQLVDAVATSESWVKVLEQLGLAEGGGSLAAIRAHAVRLGLDIAHFQRRSAPIASPVDSEPKLEYLRVAGSTLAAAWFMLRGHQVLWPLEPCRYDLAIVTDKETYLIPFADVAGQNAVSLRGYGAFQVAERGQWLSQPDGRRTAS